MSYRDSTHIGIITKLPAYGFDNSAISLIFDYSRGNNLVSF